MEWFIPQSRGQDSIRTRLFLLLCSALLITGCAAGNFESLRPGIEHRGRYIERVPFYRQTESTCGPAALAGVLAFWGHPVNQERITARVYLRDLRGTLPMDIETYARESGFQSESFSGTLDRLRETIRKGIPVICLLDLGFGPYRRPHYVTAIGFDDENRVLISHDGLNRDQVTGYDEFDKAWKRAGRWMVVIRPKANEDKHD
jgi:ABC-type bacteriocin/lantibiotic exporter with double-glycine peptidase domain